MKSLKVQTENQSRLKEISNSLKEVGSILQLEREKKLLSVKDIKDKTHIPVHYIVALENGIRDKLPEDFYLMSFIKKYARFLGLNDKAVCGKYSNKKQDNSDLDAFDSLFDDSDEDNIIELFKNKQLFDSKQNEKNILKVYHFYLFIVIFLFTTACYLIFQTMNNYYTEPVSTSSYKVHKKHKHKIKHTELKYPFKLHQL